MAVHQKDKEKEMNTAAIQVAPSPHLSDGAFTTRRMMIDVLVALLPVVAASLWVFQLFAVKQIIICVAACLAAEALFVSLRNKPVTLNDCSAAVTGVILGLSLPAPAPWYAGAIASFVAIGIGKTIFGGLGMNIFNPAMVGRAFVMISFAGIMAASGYESKLTGIDVMSQATPLNAFKQNGTVTPVWDMFLGTVNGSPGEVSAVACLIGGLYLCLRKTASWQIPFGVVLPILVFGGIEQLVRPETGWNVLHHLSSGALLFGAFFIATDPVGSPLTPKGKFIFGLGTGAIIMLLRVFSGYPEGVMFAVLLMNAVTPLINRITIPDPFGTVK